MNYPEEEQLIRLYLLGAASDEQQRHVEERLLSDDEYGAQLAIIEEELIDDYLLGVLPKDERKRFETHFLPTPKRNRKLALARDLKELASKMAPPEKKEVAPVPQAAGWWRDLFFPRWKFAAYATLLLAGAIGIWQYTARSSPIEDALAALDQAYRAARPIESRVTGFGYAPFFGSVQRGGPEGPKPNEKIDYVALERAKTLLFGSTVNRSSPAIQHALGQYFLAQKEFEKAIDQFRAAAASEPNNAQFHSDLGAALLEKIEQDRLKDVGRRKEDADECLTHLNKALASNSSLLEALFNRALFYRGERLRREAAEDWKLYREKDSTSLWAEEARKHLEEIEKAINNDSKRKESSFQEFLVAERAGNDEKALELFGLSYSYNGNSIYQRLTVDFLNDRINGREHEASEKLSILSRIGKLAEKKTGDRYVSNLADYYRQANLQQLILVKQAHEMMKDGHQLYQKSKNDPAIEKYESARQLFERAGDHDEALFAQAWIGQSHHQRSDTGQNLQIFSRLVPAYAERSYIWMEANAYCGLANAHNSSGRLSEAIRDCIKCGELSHQVGDKSGLLRSLNIRGGFYHDLGKHDEALKISQQGLDISDEIRAEIRYTIAFYQISSRSLNSLGLHELARAFQLEAVKMAEETKSPRLLARAQIHLGIVYGSWKKFDDAILHIQRGISIGRELGSDETGQELAHYGLLHLGKVYREAGRFTEALDAFNQLIEYFQKSGRQAYQYAGSKGRLLTFIAQGDDSSSKVEVDRVIELYETYRKNIQEESNRNRFFDQEQNVYDVAINFASSRLNSPRLALSYSERCRARSLFDLMRRGWETISGPETPDLRIAAEKRLDGPDEIQKQMPDRAQLIEYAIVEDKLFIWLISKTDLESKIVNISSVELSVRVKEYLEAISQPPGTGNQQQWEARSADLYDVLIRPIEQYLDRQKQICVVPDKILHRLPFETLIQRESGKLMISEFTLLYAPSANVFLRSTEKARRKSQVREEQLLAVGNPRFATSDFPGLAKLPSAEREASGVASFYKNPILLINDQARKEIVVREMERADLVHLALHYETNSWSPMLSRMPMATTIAGDKSGALHLYEIYQLRSLRPRLVVLSACQTTAEDYLGGEGAIGISRPFQAAGIPLVVASLWPVDSAATSQLMISFHQTRKKQSLPTVEALRIAQKEMLFRTGQYSHPYYWAGFIPVGGYCEF